jgi:hypothetical protein
VALIKIINKKQHNKKQNKMKSIITLITLILGTLTITAQNEFAYGYDAAGNRTSRTIITIPPPPPAAQKHKEPASVTEQLGEMEITVSPNPTQGELLLQITNMEEGSNHLKVLDLNGQVLIEQNNITESNTIDFSALPSGYYIMQLQAGNKKKEYKVVKE